MSNPQAAEKLGQEGAALPSSLMNYATMGDYSYSQLDIESVVIRSIVVTELRGLHRARPVPLPRLGAHLTHRAHAAASRLGLLWHRSFPAIAA